MKRTLPIIIVFVLLASLCFVDKVHATDAIGRITSDTTWTKSQSPITLTGPVNVNNGVTLTIEPGVTINLNNYYIQVEGTLRSIGTSAEQIHFDNGQITVKENSNGWNQQTETGNVFENNLLNNVKIYASNPLSSAHPAIKFDHNTLNGELYAAGASIITRNTVSGVIDVGGSTIVWRNTVTGRISGGGNYNNYPIISCNIVRTGAEYVNRGIGGSGLVRIENNTISGCNYGIYVITGYDAMGWIIPPYVFVERNKVTNCVHGIQVEIYTSTRSISGQASVKNNSILDCKIGIYADGELFGSTFKENNIMGSSEYQFFLKGTNVNATQNWWGTTDKSVISQKIYDSARDFNLGTVNFEPYLTAQNSQATPDLNAPMPTTSNNPTSTPTIQPSISPTTPINTISPVVTATPTSMPTQTEPQKPLYVSFDLETGIFTALIVVIMLLIVLIGLVLKRRNPARNGYPNSTRHF